jgi:hypothetical protein
MRFVLKKNSRKNYALIAAVLSVTLAGCIRPYNKPVIVPIQPHETAFLVDMSGDSDAVQNENMRKVDARNIEIRGYWIQKGRFPNSGDYYPMQKIFVVSRSPVKLYWGDEDNADANIPKVRVTSLDNVGFVVPCVINAYIEDADAAMYLKFFRPKNDVSADDDSTRWNVRLESRPLESVLNDIVYPYVNNELKRLFIGLPAIDAERNANAFITQIEPKVKEFTKQYGITVLSLVGINGIIYDNAVFQKALEEVALADIQKESLIRKENNREIARNTELADARNEAAVANAKASTINTERVRQEIENSRIISEARAEAIKTFAARAELPAVVPENTFFQLGLDGLIPTKGGN